MVEYLEYLRPLGSFEFVDLKASKYVYDILLLRWLFVIEEGNSIIWQFVFSPN